MKRVLVLLVIMVAILAIPPSTFDSTETFEDKTKHQQTRENTFTHSSASGSGEERIAIIFGSDEIVDLDLSIANSYKSPGVHVGTLDLQSYLIPGWGLYQVDIEVNSITAIAERETMAITPNTYIMIRNNTGLVTDALYQEFYKQPHDGKLENYTFSYLCPYYSASLGHAYLGVRSDYKDSQTNVTDWLTPFTQSLAEKILTHDVSGEAAILDAYTRYFVVIDGTKMQGVYAGGWWFNTIYWSATSSKLGLETGYNLRDDNWYIYQGIDRREAELNYTYTPWNKTSNSALVYSLPTQVSLQGNSSALQGTSWTFTDSENITQIIFNSNQSITLDYDMTLWYKRSTTAPTSWIIPSSGADVEWHVQTTTEYPSSATARYLNITIPGTWDPNGLYNSTDTSTNHTTFYSTGTVVTCSQLYNDTWTLKLTSENLVKSMKAHTTNDDVEIISKSLMTSNIDINSTIQEPDFDPVITGTISLEIWYSGDAFWTPSDKPVTSGSVHYFWNISEPLTKNGEYTIETSWSNGTEAGYLSKSLVLYYPTMLSTTSYSIEAFTDSSFEIRVDYSETFTSQYLNGSFGVLKYSFDGAMNQSLEDLHNGTWTGIVSTIGKNNGTYQIQVYGEGYALENRSITIDVILIHDTQSLVIGWSDGFDISYVQTTTLYVEYLMANGSAVPFASVNVSIDEQTWLLHWNGTSERYWITFNGTDVTPGLGNHSLTIQAWRYGYKYQIDTSHHLAINKEQTSLVISWDTSNTITYVGSTTLIANYTMSNGSAIVGAEVNVTIGAGSWNMTWNDVTRVYELVILGNDSKLGLAGFSVFVFAEKTGYVNATGPGTLTINPEPTSLVISWSDGKNITYIESTTLFVTFRMSDTTPITNATFVVKFLGESYDMFQYNETSYRLTFNGTNIPQGFGTFNLEISAYKYGFENSSNNNQSITLREEPTSIEISWSNGGSITFVESTILSINFTMSNGYPVLGANVTAIIGPDSWFLEYDNTSKTYRVLFFGTDEPPGVGVHDLELSALTFGFENKTDIWLVFTINPEPTILEITWDPDNDITFASYSILSVNYQMSNGTTIIGATLNMTIGDDFWEIQWNETRKLYQIRINGSDLPPGFGNHSILIQASKKGYVPASTNVTVLMRIEPTSLVIEWSNGFEPGFFEYTYLFVDYRNAELNTIYEAKINVTIGAYNWQMTWNETAERYQIRFNGSDSIPGVGNHSLLIKAGKTGYINLENSSMRLILPVVPTTLTLEFTSGMDISYVQQTTIRAYYRMYNTTPVLQAEVNVTVEGSTHQMIWNSGTEAYEYTFYGSDSPPGFGNHSLVVLAGAADFEEQSDSSIWLNLRIELTSLDISWSNGFNITYLNHTTLSVRYLMSDGISPISSAVLNATINDQFYELIWNGIAEAYETTILGSDNPPGYGTHDVIILASCYGFQYQNTTAKITIRVQDTFLRFEWDTSNIISYVNTTTFRIFYLFDESSPVLDAIVNATIGITTWTATYNEATMAYEVYFRGLDFSPPEFQIIQVKASKINYLSLEDTSQSITINEEKTSIFAYWTDGNSITFIESTTLLVNYTMSNGTTIVPDIWTDITVTIGSDTLTLTWDVDLHLYKRVFTGSDDPPGLGTHGLYIRCYKPGYILAENSSLVLYIMAADVEIACKWLGLSTITYVQSTTLEVNYTTSEGDPIEGATVNVTISGHLWNLTWNPISQTYRITFKGTDDPPGFGLNYVLDILAWKNGFNHTRDTSKRLSIIEEFTTLTAYWSNPNQNEVTYFEYTYLFVNYRMSNGSDIVWAIVNVIYNGETWQLGWNSTEGAFGLRFNWSDSPPGLGTKDLTISASAYGFDGLDIPEVIILAKDPSSLEVSWSTSNNITYVEQTQLMVYYKMSNGSLISTGTVIATIGEDEFLLVWNSSTGAYHFLFKGNMDPPGIENHSVFITAYADIYANSTISTSLTIRKEITTVYASWDTKTIDWTQSVNLSFQYRDSYGRLIEDASQKIIIIDGTEYTLFGTNGTYWFELDNSFDLGPHTIMANISKFGYFYALNESISLNIIEAYTTLSVVWSSTLIDYLGQINLEVTYAYSGTGEPVPMGIVEVNMTVDGFPGVDFEARGNVWIANLTGANDLNLGTHYITIRAQSYGYRYNETDAVLIVSPVETNELAVVWSPSNVTIEYIDRLNLTVDYTFYGGDVPEPAFVNITINGRHYDLEYMGAVWIVSIPGEELDIGIYDAFISAWAYGFAGRTNLTLGINVTFAANAFIVQWVPGDLSPTYIDTINVSVRYLADYKPIINATVTLFVNGTSYYLNYSSIDEIWHISLKACDIGLGVWNVTVTANKTGYADGWKTRILTISPALTNLTFLPSAFSIFYDEGLTIEIYYQLLNSSFVTDADLTLEVDGIIQAATWETDHWIYTSSGSNLGVGVHPFYIHVSAFGYQDATEFFDIVVDEIPTAVMAPVIDVMIFAYETTTVPFTWTDTRNSVNISGCTPEVTWPDSYSVVDHGNGSYSIQIESRLLHVGNYQLFVKFVRLGYENGTAQVNINIRELPIVLIYENEIQQFENESIIVLIQMIDGPHASVVNWGEISIELEGFEYTLVYDSELGQYSVEVWLSTLVPGVYIINFTASAIDCETERGEIHLDIIPKISYVLVLEAAEEILGGKPTLIIITASNESGPVSGLTITFYVIIQRGQEAPQGRVYVNITNIEGKATIEFNVPADATSLTIWGYYEGSISEWSSISNTVNREVTSGSVDILSIIFSLFSDPFALTLILGGSGLGLGLLTLRRSRGRRRALTPSVVEEITQLSVAKTVPMGEMDVLKDEIRKHPDGITRASIAKSLEISTSKASALVRKLLASDTSFEEIKEGNIRKIRICKEE